MPIREISRRTGLSRNTIRKYLRADIVEPSFQTPKRPSKLDPFAEKLSGWLITEQRKSRKDRRTATQIWCSLALMDHMNGSQLLCGRGRQSGSM
jgi:transcriptional regulator with XRE-family HTH domain